MEARSRTRFSHQLWPTLECVLLLPPRYLRPSFLASLVLFLLFLPLQPLTRNQTGYRQCRQRLRLAVRDGAAERVGGPLHLLASVRPPFSSSSLVFSPSLRARPPVDSSLPTYAAEERSSAVLQPSTVRLAQLCPPEKNSPFLSSSGLYMIRQSQIEQDSWATLIDDEANWGWDTVYPYLKK
jgi:hypothetical protein